MQTQPHRYYQPLLTGLGLGLFALALLMNHYHPHNGGVAALPRQSFLQKLAIGHSGGVKASSFSYLKTVAIPAPKEQPPKIPDPTKSTATESPSLPITSGVGDAQSDSSTDGNVEQSGTQTQTQRPANTTSQPQDHQNASNN